MSVFDGDGNPINVKMPTLGGKKCWGELDRSLEYVLQKNDIDGHCRILDSRNNRVAWGLEGPMRAKFLELCKFNSGPRLGDVIGVHRAGGLYDHYGIYESDDCVYEFAGSRGDFAHGKNDGTDKIDIHTTTLEKFTGKSDGYFVLVFPEEYSLPGKLEFQGKDSHVRAAIVSVANTLAIPKNLARISGAAKAYHLYSGEETISRAKEKLGNTGYFLPLNNCEHYALWCKTGLKESHQVEELLRSLSSVGMLGSGIAVGAMGKDVAVSATVTAAKTLLGDAAAAGAKNLIRGSAALRLARLTAAGAIPQAAPAVLAGLGAHTVYKMVKKTKDRNEDPKG